METLADILETTIFEKVAEGFVFTEGPVWHPDGFFYFVDVRDNKLFRIALGHPHELVRATGGGNGTTFDLQGRLINCEGDKRRLTRTELDGSVTILIDQQDGKRLNRPNDVICRSDGTLFFTDPALRVPVQNRDVGEGAVYRLTPEGQCHLVAWVEYPNGLALSPDEKTLYVANTRWTQYIHAIEIDEAGSMVRRKLFADMSIDATNGVPALIWTLDSGTLPGGLTLDNYNVGLISGLITNFGLFHFTVRVTDAKGQSSTQALSINVRQTAPGPLTIINTFLPNGAQGCAYTNQILASGGQPPYSWALAPGSDALPTGLNLGTDGTVAGLPTSATFANLIVAVSDSAGGYATQTVSLDINNSLEVFPGPLSGGTVGSNYFGGLYASGGQQLQTWTILSGSLPPGLTLDPTSGNITGTPTNVGSYNFTAQVDDGCATTNLATSITIYTSPSITTTVLPVAVPGSFYSFQLLATGGLPPYSFFTADPLPSSLQMDYTGLISGPDYSPSTNVFVTTVYDSLGTMGTATLTLISSSEPVQPQLDLPTMDAPGQFSFRVTGVTGQSYTAQYSGDLATWTDLYTTNAPAPQFLITDTNALDNRFYRVRVN